MFGTLAITALVGFVVLGTISTAASNHEGDHGANRVSAELGRIAD